MVEACKRLKLLEINENYIKTKAYLEYILFVAFPPKNNFHLEKAQVRNV